MRLNVKFNMKKVLVKWNVALPEHLQREMSL